MTDPSLQSKPAIKRLLLLLALAGAVMTQSGCIVIGLSRSEHSLVDTFSGDPNIVGSYAGQGFEKSWDGHGFETRSGSAGDAFRTERFSISCDTFTLAKESGGGLVIQFHSDGAKDRVLRFSPGRDMTVGTRYISLKLDRVPNPGSEAISETAELLLAKDKRGNLQIVEIDDVKTMTGVGIPLIPAEGKSATQYTFASIPAR